MGEEDTKLQLEESMEGGHDHQAEECSRDKSHPVENLKNDDRSTSDSQSTSVVNQFASSDEEGGIIMNSETSKITKNDSTIELSTFFEESKGSDEDADTSGENIYNSGSLVSSGKRDRKKVERLSFSAPEITKTKIEAMGAGLSLGEDPYIDHMFTHTKAEDLKFIHVLLYRRSGNKLEIKRNLRCFNGFSFSKEDEEFQSLLNRILKWSMKATVMKALRLFGQPVAGSKEELSERLADFLLCPTAVDKAAPARKRKGSASKKKSSAKKTVGKAKKVATGKKPSKDMNSANGNDTPKRKTKARRKAKPKKPEYDSHEDTEDEKSEDGSEGHSNDGEEASVTELKTKKTPVSKQAKMSKSTPARKRKTPDSDDEPLVKKVRKSAPTDCDIRVFLEGFMKSVDLEEMTMKSIYQKVYDQYPNTDLTLKKDFIKETVKQMLS